MSQTGEMVEKVGPRLIVSKWTRDLVETFRSGYSSLTEDERRSVSNLDDFSVPCQVDVFWFQPPDTQYLIATHFEDRPDLEITVNGPFQLYECVEKLESILNEPRWNRPIPAGEPMVWTLGSSPTFRDVIEGCLIGILRDLRDVPFRKPLESPSLASWYSRKSSLGPKAFVWYLTGDISKEDHSKIASQIIQAAKDDAAARRTSKPPPAPSEHAPKIQGHGSFIFPPVWIGVEPKPTFRERAIGGLSRFFPETVFHGTYKGRLIAATDDGFFAVAEIDQVKAAALLNEIMAVRLLDGNPVFSFREREVGEATVDPVTKKITGFGVSDLSLRARLVEERWNPSQVPVYHKRDVVTVDRFKSWIERAEKITQDPEIADSLRFLLEAYTHLEDSRYLESFVLSWLVVEKHLYAVWKRFLKDEGLARPRRDKLGKPGQGGWTIDHVIESLGLLKQIPADEYSKLMAMKGLRNDIVHEGERVSKQQAEEAFEAAERILVQRTGISDFQYSQRETETHAESRFGS